jgi:hypothetical protein
MALGVRTALALYGGFWNVDGQDFCYMTNHYFPPEEPLESLAFNPPTLVGSYSSTNRRASTMNAPSSP